MMALCLCTQAERVQQGLDMLTLAQELAHPFSLAYTLYFAAFLHQLRRVQSYLKYGMT